MTQRISDHDLLARVLNVHDADRLGKVSQEEVSHILSAYSDCDDNVAEHDLLSLRAAVRRVLEADAAVVEANKRRIIRGRDPVRIAAREEFYASMAALRAEMAGIDKGEGGKS